MIIWDYHGNGDLPDSGSPWTELVSLCLVFSLSRSSFQMSLDLTYISTTGFVALEESSNLKICLLLLGFAEDGEAGFLLFVWSPLVLDDLVYIASGPFNLERLALEQAERRQGGVY